MSQPTGDLMPPTLRQAADDEAARDVCPSWCVERATGDHGPSHRLELGEARLTERRQGDRTTITYAVRRRAFRTGHQSLQLRADLAVASALVRGTSRPDPLALVGCDR